MTGRLGKQLTISVALSFELRIQHFVAIYLAIMACRDEDIHVNAQARSQLMLLAALVAR